MAKAHIGPKGPGKCSAEKGKCPFGGDEVHFKTVVEARGAYETQMKNKTFAAPVQKAPVAPAKPIDPIELEKRIFNQDLQKVFDNLDSQYKYEDFDMRGTKPTTSESFRINGRWREFQFTMTGFHGDPESRILDLSETTYYGWNDTKPKPAKISGSIIVDDFGDGPKTFSGFMKYDTEYQTRGYATLGEAFEGLQDLWTAVGDGRIRYGADEGY